MTFILGFIQKLPLRTYDNMDSKTGPLKKNDTTGYLKKKKKRTMANSNTGSPGT